MRYAPFNCAKFSLFSALSQSRNPAVVCQMAAIKTKGRITGGSENVCIYVPCDLSSCSKHRAAFRDRYSTVHRFVNVFF